jgi:hypothetical protein
MLRDPNLKHHVLQTVSPVVRYGLYEMKHTSVSHSMFEIAAISYLMGRGYDMHTARRIVESWEVNETFPPYQTTTAMPGYYHPHP